MIKITDQEFEFLVGYLKQNYGINLTQKRVLLEGRLSNYLAEKGYSNYTEYIKAVQSDASGKEITNLLNKVTTNHTYFMRESGHFDYLKNTVLPYMQNQVRDQDLRTWCAASSSGEEPYTLAMILEDFFGGKIPKWDKTLLATDLSMRVLESAKKGEYLLEGIEKVPDTWKKKYFKSTGPETVQVSEYIRSQVVFQRFNLMDPIRAKKPYHIVFCRNVMIYFDAPTKAAVAQRIYDSMAPGGFLFIGQTESIARPSPFHYVMPSVYQK